MAFVPWKDRVTSTPHRYKLTEVSADTYDLEAVPGTIGEAGTPVNAANLNKLIQRDGDDIKDTVTTFTEASTRANIATGESTATLFGKIKKWYTDLKPHAFTTPSATQSTSADTVPSSKLLKESSFARVYREATEISGITYPVSITDLLTKIIADNLLNCVFVIGMNSSTETKVTGLPTIGAAPQTYGTLTIITPSTSALRMRVEYSKEIGSDNALMWLGSLIRSGNTVTSVVWKQIIDDSSAQTISGVKTFTASPLVPTTPSGPSSAVSKAYADSVGFARVYRTFAQLELENSATIAELHAAMIDRSKALIPVSTYAHALYGNTGLELPGSLFYVLEAIRSDNERLTLKLVGKAPNSDVLYHYEGMYWNYGTTDKFTGWKRIIDDSSAQTITGVKTYTASPIVPTTPSGPSAAVAKSYVDGLSTPYDKVIRTQAEFNELIASPTWLGATSVALVGQFTYSEANNSGIKVPDTVKQIHGFNSAKITVTNFVYNSDTAKGGLWYDTLPTTLDYSIRDLEVDCTGTDVSGRGFYNCTNLTNCTGTGTGIPGNGYGFSSCTNLTNCTGTGTGTGTGYGFRECTDLTNCTGTGTGTGNFGYGFSRCTNLTNCTGTGIGTGSGSYSCGFSVCTNLTNCTGKGTGTGGTNGFGFSNINYASNCKDGGSSTNMWGGPNKNIDLDTCRKTPVAADNTELNA